LKGGGGERNIHKPAQTNFSNMSNSQSFIFVRLGQRKKGHSARPRYSGSCTSLDQELAMHLGPRILTTAKSLLQEGIHRQATNNDDDDDDDTMTQ
jgi:hypothetical protein